MKTGIRAGFPGTRIGESDNAAVTSETALAVAPPPPVYAVTDRQTIVSRWLPELCLWRKIVARASSRWNTFRLSRRDHAAPADQVIDQPRFWEIDLNRGIAIVSMLVHHLIHSWLLVVSVPLAGLALSIWTPLKILWLAGLFAIPLLGGAMLLLRQSREAEIRSSTNRGWKGARILLSVALLATLGVTCGWLASVGTGGEAFAFIMGVAMTITYSRAQRNPKVQPVFAKYLTRGLVLLGAGVAITLMSYLLTPQAPILFGILQLLGLANILAYPFLGLSAWVSLAVGLPMIGLGAWLWETQPVMNGIWGLLFGIPPVGLAMSDYWSLPWLGLVLLGVAVGKTLYPQGQRKFRLPDLSEARLVRMFSRLGKNALPIYLFQEPVALAGIALVHA